MIANKHLFFRYLTLQFKKMLPNLLQFTFKYSFDIYSFNK